MVRKKCEYCGEEFDAVNSSVKICDKQHYNICVICGKEFPITRSSIVNNSIKRTCSKNCQKELVKQTNRSRYGVDYPMSTTEFKSRVESICFKKYGVKNAGASNEAVAKRLATTKARYGHEYALQCDEFKEKARRTYETHYAKDSDSARELSERRKKTMIDKYGGDSPMTAPCIRAEIESTNEESYGCKNPLGNSEVRKKFRNTMKKKHGAEYTLQCPDLRAKVEDSMIQRYGVCHPSKMDTYQNKVISTNFERYGVSHFSQLSMKEKGVLDNYLNFKSDPRKFIADNFDYGSKPTAGMLQSIIGADLTLIWSVIHENQCEDIISIGKKSSMEEDVLYELSRLNLDQPIIRNTKKVIYPYELDIYLPDMKLAIECNPTSTHNSSKPCFPDGEVTPRDYHKMKTDMCEEKGIFLFHIFGYEWTNKRHVILSMLKNVMKCNSYRIYARNCMVDMNVPYKESKIFLDMNHRQGNTNAKYRLGLRDDNGDLVALMCFNRPRSTIGQSLEYTPPVYELSRFCCKTDTNVLGGASRLFSHFVNSTDFGTIISYSDRAHAKGTLYDSLGFKKYKVNDPNYVWVHYSNDSYYTRLSTQKRNLRNLFHDNTIDISRTEKDIMEEHKYLQVFDSGTVTWVYRK